MASFQVRTKFTLKSNVDSIRAAIHGNLENAMNALKDSTVEWVQDQMMHGYNDPHGPDGHTEIYDTGALHDSIKASVDSSGFLNLGHTLRVGSPLDYASYVHNGTRKLKGRPFLRDALIIHQKDIENVIKEHIKKGMD